ncbi:COQ9 family protein [Sphingomonas daechungensis]|uniref:COQ9 family protein n=1 Tax=Sphingomonas daechungensis TaxID=1176646 RepID=A0ABX6T2U1_9SPHN|nr:COQ9 family protein [Sphingomonas daechungensis]QNP44095.1 COQ9 family protein [Sphingomonas daechungensis]
MEQPSPLKQIRDTLALAVGENAVFDGWTQAAVDSAAAQLGIDPDQARLAVPKDQAGKIDTYISAVDQELEAWFTPERLQGLKIREKIRGLIWKRLEIMAPAREAVRRALSILAMPQNLPTGLKSAWRTADTMWRIAGDTSTDFNHYTKRMTLSGVYGSTLLVWINDETEGWMETSAFLDRRIEDVMQFEKFKAQWKGQEHFSVTRFLGRLRYPAR